MAEVRVRVSGMARVIIRITSGLASASGSGVRVGFGISVRVRG